MAMSELHDVIFRIPLTAAQRRLIKKAAEQKILNSAQWARSILMQAAQKEVTHG